MNWREWLSGSEPKEHSTSTERIVSLVQTEQSELYEQFTPNDRIVSIVQIVHKGVKLESTQSEPLGPATEATFQRESDRHTARVSRLYRPGTLDTIHKAAPELFSQIMVVDTAISRLWLSARRGERTFPDAWGEYQAVFRTWARANIEGIRFVRFLNREIRRIYSRKLGKWVYIVQNKTSVKGVRLRPRGAVYTFDEARVLVDVNPGMAELKTLHRAKTLFEGVIS